MAESKKIEKGDHVKFHYSGKFDDGEIFDSTKGLPPFEMTVGDGKVLPAFEKNLIGMAEGETKTFRIPSEEAYGPIHGELMIEVPREQLPEEIEPHVGMRLKVPIKSKKKPISVKIIGLSDVSITIDANHPLAGRDLTFAIKVVSIEKPTI